ncbi:biotin synthase auxiliary protein BsaP [Sinomonas halotolerans]
MAHDAAASFCGQCGGVLAGGVLAGGAGATGEAEAHGGAEAHGECRRRALLEPPRFCADCGRRMKVQITPAGWSAECSRHGTRGR